MQQTFNFRCKLPNYDGCGDDAHDNPDHPARRACALRVLGLLLADGAPTVQWGGGRLFDGSTNILDESTKFFLRKLL